MVIGLLACVSGPLTETGDETGDEIPPVGACGLYDRSDVVGASWTWAYDDDANWPGGWTTTVSSRFEEGGRTLYLLETDGSAEPPGRSDYHWSYQVHVSCDEGWVRQWWSYGSTYDELSDGTVSEWAYETVYEDGYRLRPTELEVGSSWTGGGKRRVVDASDGSLIVEEEVEVPWEVLEQSSVSVPAGEFDSLRATDGEGVVHIVEGLGFVRWEGFSWLLSTGGL